MLKVSSSHPFVVCVKDKFDLLVTYPTYISCWQFTASHATYIPKRTKCNHVLLSVILSANLSVGIILSGVIVVFCGYPTYGYKVSQNYSYFEI